MAGVNDNCTPSTGAVFLQEVQYVLARKAVGWKRVLPITILDHFGADACKNSFDTLIRNYPWPDGYIDAAGDPNIGADGSAANAGNTWWQASGLHPTSYAHYNDLAPIVQARINEEYGNLSLNTATIYASAAAAAVATTAGSEATNTVTITTAATPANCVVGSTVTVVGTTPAGYSGVFNILTRSATQITYFDVSGLGAISVQGTIVCPQQQESDVVEILNFGAGNHTLQTCQKFLGMKVNNGGVTIQNINGVASTLVPFGTETITGVGATLATGATAFMIPKLVSSAAAGCTWNRVQ